MRPVLGRFFYALSDRLAGRGEEIDLMARWPDALTWFSADLGSF